MLEKQNLLGLPQDKLKIYFSDLGEKSFRTKQIMQWIYHQGDTSFGDMQNLSKDLNEKHGSGFSTTNLANMRQFFVTNPNIQIRIFLVIIFMPYGANVWCNAPELYIAHAPFLRNEISKKNVTGR